MIQTTEISARFLLAKHVPDLRRMEPRNIGVIVWSHGLVRARFAGDPGSRSPRHTGPNSSYQEWVTYWRNQISKPELRRKDGTVIRVDELAFVEQLRTASKTQYMLVDGGAILDPIGADNIDEATEDLFQQLVESPKERQKKPGKRETTVQLNNSTKAALTKAGLFGRQDFRERYPWVCPVGETRQSFQFDFAIHTTAGPQALFQRVQWKSDAIYSTAFQFDHMRAAYSQLTREKCVAFVFADNREMNDSKFVERRSMMNQRGSIVNVLDTNVAVDELLSLLG